MPSEGDWEGPIYGQIGALSRVGDTVECHACGASFASVGHHAWQVHNLTAMEYRAIFGLGMTTSLAGEALRSKLSGRMRDMIARGAITTIDQRPEDVPTPEQNSARLSGRRRRREAQAYQGSPEFRAKMGAAISKARGGKKTMTCVVCGTQKQMYWASRTKTCSPQCFATLTSRRLKGKPKSAEHREKLSQARKRTLARKAGADG